jgi:hypothetical protein
MERAAEYGFSGTHDSVGPLASHATFTASVTVRLRIVGYTLGNSGLSLPYTAAARGIAASNASRRTATP